MNVIIDIMGSVYLADRHAAEVCILAGARRWPIFTSTPAVYNRIINWQCFHIQISAFHGTRIIYRASNDGDNAVSVVMRRLYKDDRARSIPLLSFAKGNIPALLLGLFGRDFNG